MTENQSAVEEIAMINCDGKILKFSANEPLTFGASRLWPLAGQRGIIASGNLFFDSRFGNSIRSNTGETFAHYP
ncbi:hypothetical protein [Burkholderia sp. BCC1988]|uniref:hypothetical protein n=1 Tax=Burkholderia sp. BCC1988 TaxID=2817443 RepID=UPI002AB0862C|nr:hypothetical protein [Burkholderia sp. BCC1988]